MTQAVGPQARGTFLNQGFFNPIMLGKPSTNPSPPLRWEEFVLRCGRATLEGPNPCQYFFTGEVGARPAQRPLLSACCFLRPVTPPRMQPSGGARWRSPGAQVALPPDSALVGCCSPELQPAVRGFLPGNLPPN